jgi:hypothetical protein
MVDEGEFEHTDFSNDILTRWESGPWIDGNKNATRNPVFSAQELFSLGFTSLVACNLGAVRTT